MDYCEFALSESAPFKVTSHGTRQTVSTMVLLNAMRNVACGMKHVGRFRTVLNDLYMAEIKGHADHYNPDPRVIIEGAMEVLLESELDTPLGNNSGLGFKGSSSSDGGDGGLSINSNTDSILNPSPSLCSATSASISNSPTSEVFSSTDPVRIDPVRMRIRTKYADRYYR